MAQRRSPQSKATTLDELAHLLATGSRDSDRIESGCKTLRKRLRTGLGVPYHETENAAQDGITRFLEVIAKDPGNRKLISGGLLWTVTRNRCIDRVRAAIVRNNTGSIDAMEEHVGENLLADASREAYEDQQLALSLQMHAGSVLRRLGRTSEEVLGKPLARILEMVHLVASNTSSSKEVIAVSVDRLCAEGVLGDAQTQDLRNQLRKSPRLRRELGMPDRPIVKLPKPSKPEPPGDE